jgi:hypothetical protein
MARGSFPRAEVIRATDWDYGDDDGMLTLHVHVGACKIMQIHVYMPV